MVSSTALYDCLLSDLGVDPKDTTPPDSSISFYAKIALKDALLSKLADEKSPLADFNATQKFIQSNDLCASLKIEPRSSKQEVLLGIFKQKMYEFFEPKQMPLIHSHHSIFDRARTGPGSSFGATNKDFFSKLFGGPLTCTTLTLYSLYSDWLRSKPTWELAEAFRNRSHGGPKLVEGNMVSFVNKKVDISRMVASEPSLNMFAQLGLAAILCSRLRKVYHVDLSYQPDINREMARVGSLYDNYATIDLVDASNRISKTLIDGYVPKSAAYWLKLLRSPKTTFPDGASYECNMISTMGNGTTFPLQTIIFSCMVDAVHTFRGIPLKCGSFLSKDCPRSFSVFGDDIIVRSDLADDLLELIALLGFEANQTKTFVRGNFRESCGQDFYRGRNVRGVYIKTLLRRESLYAAINHLVDWSAYHGIPLNATIAYLLKGVPHRYVPKSAPVDSGIQAPLSLVNFRRYNENGTLLSKQWRPIGIPVYRVEEDKLVYPKKVKRKKRAKYNPDGVYLAFLGGYIRDGKVFIRQENPVYTTKEVGVPNWDFYPPTSRFMDVSWTRWESWSSMLLS